MRTRIIAILIVLAFICIALPNKHSPVEQARGDNLAGDLDQLPENEEMLDLRDGEYDYETYGAIYRKNNTFVQGMEFRSAENIYRPPEQLFDGTHAPAGISSGSTVNFRFAFPLIITRIRVYPMDESGMKCGTGCCKDPNKN